jgi:hypothetical protein
MEKSKQFTYGLGGLGVLLGFGAFLLRERGREIVKTIGLHLEQAPENIEHFADATQRELDRIQQKLDEIAARLEAVG